jgi:hypothetical protein
MKAFVCIAALLFAVPVLAADAQPDVLPSSPAVSYDVWGFQWNGQQWVRQETYTLKSTDIKQAQAYADQINSYFDWAAATNIPEPSVVHTVFSGQVNASTRPSPQPDPVSFAVWAFKLTDGKFVKNDQYSWTTPDPIAALDYSQKLNAISGWRATTNAPATVPEAQRYVDGGPVNGLPTNAVYPGYTYPGYVYPRYSHYYHHHYPYSTHHYHYPNYQGSSFFGFPGVSISNGVLHTPLMNIQLPPGAQWNVNSNNSDNGASFDNSQAIQDSINLQNQISNQDMINQQQMNNNIQDMLNTQNFNNTEDMINSQNAINAQQMMNP